MCRYKFKNCYRGQLVSNFQNYKFLVCIDKSTVEINQAGGNALQRTRHWVRSSDRYCISNGDKLALDKGLLNTCSNNIKSKSQRDTTDSK